MRNLSVLEPKGEESDGGVPEEKGKTMAQWWRRVAQQRRELRESWLYASQLRPVYHTD